MTSITNHKNELLIWRPLLQQLSTSFMETDPAHDISHIERVWANAQRILIHHAEANHLVVMAACYLHDIVNLPKNHPDRSQASIRSAEKAKTYLEELGFPTECLDDVFHAIAAHSYSANIEATSLEAKIVQDADRLDSLGAIGLARMFHIGGQLNSGIVDAKDPLAKERELDDARFSLDHITTKLLKLPELMKTFTGKAYAVERVEWIISFQQRCADECMGLK